MRGEAQNRECQANHYSCLRHRSPICCEPTPSYYQHFSKTAAAAALRTAQRLTRVGMGQGGGRARRRWWSKIRRRRRTRRTRRRKGRRQRGTWRNGGRMVLEKFCLTGNWKINQKIVILKMVFTKRYITFVNLPFGKHETSTCCGRLAQPVQHHTRSSELSTKNHEESTGLKWQGEGRKKKNSHQADGIASGKQ